MFARLFGKKMETTRTEPSVPAGVRVYAIGDIHGCNALLIDLLDQINADDAARNIRSLATQTTVIFLGDLMDRGPDSAGVINTAIAYRDTAEAAGKSVRFLMGNHEEMYLESVSGSTSALRYFLKYGGKETVLSYGMTPEAYDALDFDELAQRLLTLVPRDHADFVRDFEDCVILGDYAFVHAGIRPGVPIDAQKPKDMRWIRDVFLESHAVHDKMIVFGHTIFDDVDIVENRIGVDTGAYRSGILSAIALEGSDRWVLQARGDAHPELAQRDWAG
jgi:serine/threonine protein phosphatase 1